MDQLASCVYRALIPFYAMHSSRRDPVWREPSVAGSVHVAWRLWRELMRQAGSGMRALMRRWSLLSKLREARRHQHQLSRVKRCERLDMLCHRVSDAARTGNQRELHKVVRLLCPKVPHRRLQLRAQGQLLGAQEEAALITEHMRQQFASSPSEMSAPGGPLHMMPFLEGELVDEIARLRTYKAVPRNIPPMCFWKRMASVVGPVVWRLLSHSWCSNSVSVPTSWKGSWLHFIPGG